MSNCLFARALVLLVMLSVVILPACGEDEVAAPQRRVYTLTYSLNITGESAVEQVTYSVGGQDVTVDNPGNGWSVQFPGGDGQRVGTSAQGFAKNGEIKLYFNAQMTGQPAINRVEECRDTTGNARTCMLVIPKITLP